MRSTGRAISFTALALAILVACLLSWIASPVTAQSVPQPGHETAAEAEFVPGELLVKFKETVPELGIAAAGRARGLAHRETIERLGVGRFAVPPGQEKAIARALADDPNVEYAEPNYILHSTWTPNDPQYSSQWGLTKVNAPAAWDLSRGSGVVIAIVDSGVDLDHPDLASKLVDPSHWKDYVDGDTWPDDENGHGTHVAGIAAAATNNGTGVAGMAPDARIMPVRVLDKSGDGSSANLAQAIRFAVDHGARVINLSLGAQLPVGSMNAVQDEIDNAISQGVVVVAAAGNFGRLYPYTANGVEYAFYPAYYAPVIAVGATMSSDTRAPFSNYGPWVDLVAPGEGIYATFPGSYKYMSGTSMATPLVSGAVALLRARYPWFNVSVLEGQLCYGTVDLGDAGKDDQFGCGRLDAYRMLTEFTPEAKAILDSLSHVYLPLVAR